MNTIERSYSYIAVAGPQEYRKTVFGERIAKQLKYQFIPHDDGNNPHDEHERFQALTHTLTQKMQQFTEVNKLRQKRGVVVDTPAEQIVFADGRVALHGYDWGLFSSLFATIQEAHPMVPSLVICLEADAQRALTQFNHEWIISSSVPTIHLDFETITQSFNYKALAKQIRTKLAIGHR